MASSSPVAVTDYPILHRPNSRSSVASNSSVASGTSLSRRPRTTRARSRTITGGSPNAVTEVFPGLPYLEKPLVDEPDPQLSPGLPQANSPHPLRPPRSPQRPSTTEGRYGDVQNDPGPSTVDVESFTLNSVEVPPVENQSSQSKASKKASSLPGIVTSNNPPSAFSRVAPSAVPSVVNVRDSVLTQDSVQTTQSGVSSSLYPPSTSTESGADSPPSPRSMAEQLDSHDVPIMDDLHEYDGDDVSYRLRLLVKNNYFLPPAHSKPSPLDLAPAVQTYPRKASSPAFLDIFRVGKSKSKPTTPSAPTHDLSNSPPILRTTSDSSTMGFAPYPEPRTSAHTPRTPQPDHFSDRTGRVVVVREKMLDLASAAKQAEQDMKARSGRQQGSQRDHATVLDDVVDPTDAVDLPPPSSAYPFAVQASALHGLDAQHSVGAALLADRLPPPQSPGGSYDVDVDWRKALLHAAVGHSFDNLQSMSSPLASPNPSTLISVVRTSTPARFIGKRIISSPIADTSDELPSSPLANKSTPSEDIRRSALSSPEIVSSRPSSHIPLRVETPVMPLTPLTPPPRKYAMNSSTSQSAFQSDEQIAPPRSHASTSSLRRAISSPSLADAHDNGARHVMTMTPPPLPSSMRYSDASLEHEQSFYETSRERDQVSVATSGSIYSVDDRDQSRRPSTSLSRPAERPSLSEYSQSSPTASAFQDMLNHSHHGGYDSTTQQRSTRSSVDSHALNSQASAAPRYSATSPPPRVSSTFAPIALSPPPRGSSLRNKITLARPPTAPESSSSGRSTPTPSLSPMQILAPEPTTPPFPLSGRRGNPSDGPLSLHIPSHYDPPAIHSAPVPASPTAFFDSIQSQPNAMDDLESSSDEDDSDVDYDDDDADDPRGPPSRLYVDPRSRTISSAASAWPAASSRAPIMRLGNHSTPYVARPLESPRPSLPFGVADPKKPIGHVPQPAPFFTQKKFGSDQGHGAPTSTFDLYKYTQQHSMRAAMVDSPSSGDSAPVRPATAVGDDRVQAWQQKQRAHDSLKKLDGMLIQHMEAEKDTMKRIATNIQSNTMARAHSFDGQGTSGSFATS